MDNETLKALRDGFLPLLLQAGSVLIMGLVGIVLYKVKEWLGVKADGALLDNAMSKAEITVRSIDMQATRAGENVIKKEAAMKALDKTLSPKLQPLKEHLIEAAVSNVKEKKNAIPIEGDINVK